MLKKVKPVKTAKLNLALHIADVCKKLHGKKCPNALDSLLVALNLHHTPIVQTPQGIQLDSDSPKPRVLVMNPASAKFAMGELVSKYALHDPEPVRSFIRHQWTKFKPDSAKAPQGKYFTPAHVGRLLEDLVNPILEEMPEAILLDPAAGHGGLLSGFESQARVVADIDPEAVRVMAEMGFKSPLETNSLLGVSRAKFGITDSDKVIVVSNPPFNDGTSQHKRVVKAAAGTPAACDLDLVTRDTGAAFMLMAAKINADAVVMIHPLSYLIKQTNFDRLSKFAAKYKLVSGVVISSAEFATGGKPFPLVLAVYRKGSMTFADIEQFEFPIYRNANGTFLDSGTRLKLAAVETTQGFIRSTVPTKGMPKVSTLGLHQYNFRDINFVESSGNLTETQSDSTIPVELPTLGRYSYINCVKRHFDSDFVNGNLSPLVRKTDFNDPVFVDTCIYDAIISNQRLTPFLRTNPASIVLTKGLLADAQKKAGNFKGTGVNPYTAFITFWTLGTDKEALAPFFKDYFATLKAANLIHKPNPLANAMQSAQAAATPVV